MRSTLLLALAVVSTVAHGEPARSQHPRVGQLAEIQFAVSSARIPVSAATNEQLGEVAAWAEENPEGLIVLDGHADRTGEELHNVRLSMARGAAVRDELVELGLDPDQIVVAAYGEAGPQRTAPAENRRVTVWGTHEELQAVRKRSLVNGTTVLRSSVTRGRPTVAGGSAHALP